MIGSTIPIAIIGSRFAMSLHQFWKPIQFIPIVGMLCGATITGIVIAVSFILRELQENRDKVEIYLAFGASRSHPRGSSVQQAAKLQMIIMFMITASTTLASVFEHRIRGDRIESNGKGWLREFDLRKLGERLNNVCRRRKKEDGGTPGERQRLLA
ncbi:hypothetical protein CPB84DRAFT_1763758 [Gymnopilus junonius]|uniref:Uncharacterized protein n=1 Tax=Gymnopilus junonius TaxID=109634 RepID=A0A9P5NXY3_GYMJU|nr:hypothetical protein CPB84DRAFT_1763758 [Gymnopilus junonius]